VIREAAAAVVEALAGEGLRVATRAADVSPPCVFVAIANTEDAGATFAGGLLVSMAVSYIPVRGVDNLDGDADGLDAVFRALRPLATRPLSAPRSSLTLSNETWPCYRAEVAALALDTVEAR
jgi:hypothetical protein